MVHFAQVSLRIDGIKAHFTHQSPGFLDVDSPAFVCEVAMDSTVPVKRPACEDLINPVHDCHIKGMTFGIRFRGDNVQAGAIDAQ